MRDHKEDEPAFPVVTSSLPSSLTGITKRDFFAAAALTGLMTDHSVYSAEHAASLAFAYANQMMAERDK